MVVTTLVIALKSFTWGKTNVPVFPTVSKNIKLIFKNLEGTGPYPLCIMQSPLPSPFFLSQGRGGKSYNQKSGSGE